MILSEYDRELHIRSEKQISYEEGIDEGKLEENIENILSLLSDLGPVPPELEKRIRSETDYTLLRGWLKLAARAETVQGFIDRIS